MSQLLLTKTVTEVTVAAATLATEPPAAGNMLNLSERSGRASVWRCLLQLRGAGAATLSNGKVWGRDLDGRMKHIGWVRDGVAIAVDTTLGTDQVVENIAAYDRLGVTGTLTASSLVMGLLELEEDD